jgi:hypothetical protein
MTLLASMPSQIVSRAVALSSSLMLAPTCRAGDVRLETSVAKLSLPAAAMNALLRRNPGKPLLLVG